MSSCFVLLLFDVLDDEPFSLLFLLACCMDNSAGA
jgi:hypothetical protein